MKSPVAVPLDELSSDPYASVLCFPRFSETEAKARTEELRSQGVTSLVFSGKANVFGVPVPVLGKGYVGIVVIAYLKGERVAVKIRRTDADRVDLFHEAKMLTKASSVDVAPKFMAVSKNFLLMKLIEGDTLPDWLKTPSDKAKLKNILEKILERCYKLDEIGLDHGELSKAPKHVLIDKDENPWLVDFETASDKRKPANVTAICSFLFTGEGDVAKRIAEVLGKRDRGEIIRALKTYKNNRTRDNLENVLKTCLA
jgi:putative serine/threonine protein kinase